MNKRLDSILKLHEAPLARPEVSLHADSRDSAAALDEALRVALQLEAWTKDARQRSNDGYRKPKIRGAVGDTVRLAERLDRIKNIGALIYCTLSTAHTVLFKFQ